MAGSIRRRRPRPLLDRRLSTLLLIVADVAVISLVLTVGLLVHGSDPFADVGHVVRTTTPFVLGWLLAATLTGAYSARARSQLASGLMFVTISWGGATLIGSGLRSTDLFPGGAPPIFVAVTFATGLVVLAPWRAIVTGLVGRL